MRCSQRLGIGACRCISIRALPAPLPKQETQRQEHGNEPGRSGSFRVTSSVRPRGRRRIPAFPVTGFNSNGVTTNDLCYEESFLLWSQLAIRPKLRARSLATTFSLRGKTPHFMNHSPGGPSLPI